MTHTCSSCGFPIRIPRCRNDCNHRTHCDCDASDERESLDTVEDYDLSCGRTVKRHAVNRWQLRNGFNPPCDIGEAWETALPVGASEVHGTARLYPPSDLVLVAHGDAVRTALLREWAGELTMDHLNICGECALPWNPEETNDCPWCDEEDDATSETTQNTMTTREPTVDSNEPGEMHECPVCSDMTMGDGDDDRCKVCRELERSVDDGEEEEEQETCAECFNEPEPGSDYCEMHSFLASTEGIHAE